MFFKSTIGEVSYAKALIICLDERLKYRRRGRNSVSNKVVLNNVVLVSLSGDVEGASSVLSLSIGFLEYFKFTLFYLSF